MSLVHPACGSAAAALRPRLLPSLRPAIGAVAMARVALAMLVALASLAAIQRLQRSPLVQTVAVGTAPTALAVDERSGRIFVANVFDARVSVLDAMPGDLVTTARVAPSPTALAVAPTSGLVFVVTNSRAFNGHDGVDVLDAASGQLLRTIPVGRDAAAIVVDEHAGHVFVANRTDGTVSMLDAASGRVLRTITVGAAPAALALDQHDGLIVVLDEGRQYDGYPVGPSSLSLVQARSGRVVRTVGLGYRASAVALDAGSGHIFVADRSDDTVTMLSARTGAVLRTTAVGRDPVAMAVDARIGRLFTSNDGDRTVSVLDTHSGSLVASVSLGAAPTALAVDEQAKRVYALTGQDTMASPLHHHAGAVAVLDGRSGRLLHTVPVGIDPQAIVVDERDHRVAVANVGGSPNTASLADRFMAWAQHWLPIRLPPRAGPIDGSVTILDTSRL